MPKTIEGVLTAIVTPFTATGSLNIPAPFLPIHSGNK